jgi:hypothetical protein
MRAFRATWLGLVMVVPVVACTGHDARQSVEAGRASVATGVGAPTVTAASAPAASTTRVTASVVVPPAAAARVATDALRVKRFVIAKAVREREPVPPAEPLHADGTRVYAFAELANPDGASENVRITFERKGGKERVGDVTLPVPGNATRYRTWAFTRNIFAPGVWEAVLWSERGVELSRTSFDVKAS